MNQIQVIMIKFQNIKKYEHRSRIRARNTTTEVNFTLNG